VIQWPERTRATADRLGTVQGISGREQITKTFFRVEAFTWKSALDLDEGPRKGQRVVIYPKEMTQLEQVLSTGDPSIDDVDGHPIAYTCIMQAAQLYEHPPIFLREDSEEITRNEETATKAPVWMNIAAQVATGNRRMVLEDGPDKMNSDDDDTLEEENGDKSTGTYTPETGPKQGPVRLTTHQIAVQKERPTCRKHHRVPNRQSEGVQTRMSQRVRSGYGLKRKVACARTSISESAQ
jgi:hypothetical protein